jgi:hypothetical protein
MLELQYVGQIPYWGGGGGPSLEIGFLKIIFGDMELT